MRFSVTPAIQNALFRYVAAREARGAPPRQPAGHYGKWLNWANALEQPPASLRGGPAGVGLGPDRTEKRSLRVGPHGKAQCAWLLAYRMRLLVRRADRVRFSVTPTSQNALFRYVAAREA